MHGLRTQSMNVVQHFANSLRASCKSFQGICKMGTVRQGWRHLHETWRLTLRGLMKHHAALSERFSPGIIARLLIFFVGVGGLVLATSLAVEHGVLVERTTQITQLPVP